MFKVEYSTKSNASLSPRQDRLRNESDLSGGIAAPCKREIPATGKGKKHDNSLLLQEFISNCEEENLFSPLPLGFTSEFVKNIFYKKAPETMEKITDAWKELYLLYAQETEKHQFWERNSTIEKFASIEKLIFELFERIEFFPFPQKILLWMEELNEKKSKIIVRSSGDEDGDGREDSTIGAGIHKSVENVEAHSKAVSHAMAEVISSYMAIPAMRNKALEKHNPFHTLPAWSLMLQEFISETEEEIPISLVMATNELMYIDEKSERVTTLNCTYGFGDGVTGGLVVTDSILMVRSKHNREKVTIYYENRNKMTRIYQKKEVKNKKKLRTNPALSKTMLKRLYRIAGKLETFFGRAMDIEIVIRGEEIYLVQARDLVRKIKSPSFVELEGLALQTTPCTPAIPTASRTTIITNPDAILFDAPTLEEAEKRFNPKKHALVIVERATGEYSHSAIFFSSLNKHIPCFIADKNEMKALLSLCSPKRPLVFDVQQGLCLLLEEGILPETIIKKGWHSHPCGIKYSFALSENVPVRIQSPSSYARILEEDVKSLRSKRPETVHAAILALQKNFYEHLSNLNLENIYLETHYQQIASKIAKAAQKILIEIQTLVEDTDSSFLERLLHIKMLEKVFFQSRISEWDYSLSTFSLRALHDELNAHQISTEYLRDIPDALLAKEAGYCQFALTPELKKNWIQFLKSVEKEEAIQDFKEMLDNLNALNMLPLWMILFDEEHRSASSTTFLLEKLLNSFGKSEKQLCLQLAEYHKSIELLIYKVTHISDREGLHRSWKESLELMEQLQNEELIKKFEESSTIAQLMMLHMLEEALSLLDIAIKEARKSGILRGEELTCEIRCRVYSLINFLDAWGSSLLNLSKGKKADSKKKYLNSMRNSLQACSNDEKELEASPNFNVAAMLWGNSINSDGKDAQSIEDNFMKAHQTMLVWIGLALDALLGNKIREKKVSLPPMLDLFLDLVSSNPKMVEAIEEKRFHCVGFLVNENNLTLRYNLAIQTHSMGLEVSYDIKSEKLSFQIQVFGWQFPRGQGIFDYLSLLSMCEKREVIDPPCLNQIGGIFEVRWAARSKEELAQFIEDFFYVEYLTFFKSYDEDLALKWWNRFTDNATDHEKTKSAIRSIIQQPDLSHGISYFCLCKEINIHSWLIASQDVECVELAKKFREYVIKCFVYTPWNSDHNLYRHTLFYAFKFLKKGEETDLLWRACQEIFFDLTQITAPEKPIRVEKKSAFLISREDVDPHFLKIRKMIDVFALLCKSNLSQELENEIIIFLKDALDHRDKHIRELGVIAACTLSLSEGLFKIPSLRKINENISNALAPPLIVAAQEGLQDYHLINHLEKLAKLNDSFDDLLIEMSEIVIPTADARTLLAIISLLYSLLQRNKGFELAIQAISQFAKKDFKKERGCFFSKDAFSTIRYVIEKDQCYLEVLHIFLSLLSNARAYIPDSDLKEIQLMIKINPAKFKELIQESYMGPEFSKGIQKLKLN